MLSHSIGKHIRLYLVDGSPSGIITAEIMGWTGKVLSFSRLLLPEALKRPECAKTGLYFLTGVDEELGQLLYIGESDDVAKRLKQHDSTEDKAFFDQVTLVVSKDENLTKSHVRYLENRVIHLAQKSATTLLKNNTQGSDVFLPEAEQSDMEYLIQQLQILLPILGLFFLKEPPKRYKPLLIANDHVAIDQTTTSFELIYLKGQIKASGYEAEGAFVVEKGSQIRNLKSTNYDIKVGEALFSRYANYYNLTNPIDNTDEIISLTEDIAFKSPSGAAKFICGASVNGRLAWKVKGTNQTYEEWRKQQLEAIIN